MRDTRKDVIARTRREFAQLDRLVSRLRPTDWTRPVSRPPTRDPWTVKDALAHIVYWKEHTARVIRGERRPPEMRGLDVNQINRVIYERWRRRRPSEVVAWHRRVHEEVLRTLARTQEECIGRRDRSRPWPTRQVRILASASLGARAWVEARYDQPMTAAVYPCRCFS